MYKIVRAIQTFCGGDFLQVFITGFQHGECLAQNISSSGRNICSKVGEISSQIVNYEVIFG
jgi:hypothetical protein